MGFTTKENMVRVDIFKPSGKWYDTVELGWVGYNGYIHSEFEDSIRRSVDLNKYLGSGFTIVCLEPFNINSFPLMRSFANINEQKL